MMVVFTRLIVMVSQMYRNVKTYQIWHLKYMGLYVCPLFLNKAVKNRQKNSKMTHVSAENDRGWMLTELTLSLSSPTNSKENCVWPQICFLIYQNSIMLSTS